MKNFFRMPNNLFESISCLRLSQCERQAIDVILRCTYGCNKEKAILIQRDFTVFGLSETMVKDVISRLVDKNVIQWDRENSIFELNEKHIMENGKPLMRITDILSKNLRNRDNRAYKDSKRKLTETISPNGDIRPSLSHNAEPKDSKDILNTTKTSGAYNDLLDYLSKEEGIRSPKGYLDDIVSKYGEECLPWLYKQNQGYNRWYEYLDYWKGNKKK